MASLIDAHDASMDVEAVSPKNRTATRFELIPSPPVGAMNKLLTSRADPDAQTTVTDFLDFTEYLPSDMTRSLTLIRKLDQTYTHASLAVDDLTTTWGQLPTLAADERPSPVQLRADISDQLNQALNSRVFAHAEAVRMSENVSRHYHKATALLAKLKTMMDNYPAEEQTSPAAPKSPQMVRTKLTVRATGEDGQKIRKNRVPRITVPGEVLAPYEIEYDTLSDDSDISTDEDSDAPPTGRRALAMTPRIKINVGHKNHKAAHRQTRPVPFSSPSMGAATAAAAAAAANAAALMNPPPEDAVVGSPDRPWLQLTHYELAKLRKRMKKNATWSPSETMIARELKSLGRGPDAYRAAKKTAEDEGRVFEAMVPAPVIDDESGAQQLPAGAISIDSLAAEEVPTSNRGMKLNEAKKLKREQLAKMAAEEAEESARKMQQAAKLFLGESVAPPPPHAPGLGLELSRDLRAAPQSKRVPKPRTNSRAQSKRKRSADESTNGEGAGEGAEVPSKAAPAKRSKTETPVPPPYPPGRALSVSAASDASAPLSIVTPTPVPIPILPQVPNGNGGYPPLSTTASNMQNINATTATSTPVPVPLTNSTTHGSVKGPTETPVPLPKKETVAKGEAKASVAPIPPPPMRDGSGRETTKRETRADVAKRAQQQQQQATAGLSPSQMEQQANKQSSSRTATPRTTPGPESLPRRPSPRVKATSQEPQPLSLAADRPRRTSTARNTPVPEIKPPPTKRPKRPAPGVVSATNGGGNSAVGKRKAAPTKKKKTTRAGGSKKDKGLVTEPQPEPEPEPEMEEEVDDEGNVIDPNEARYCLCNNVSFGTMIQCDNVDVSGTLESGKGEKGQQEGEMRERGLTERQNCKQEWFHLECVGLTDIPARTTKWYCPDCRKVLNIGEKGEVSARGVRK